MQIDNEPLEESYDGDAQPLMTDEEFEHDLALAAEGRWEELDLHAGPIPGFEKVPINDILDS